MKVESPGIVRIGWWVLGVHLSARWLHVVAGRPFLPGVVMLGLIFGFDADVPWRPWPQLWFEIRPNGSHLTALVWCGFGVQVQTAARGTS